MYQVQSNYLIKMLIVALSTAFDNLLINDDPKTITVGYINCKIIPKSSAYNIISNNFKIESFS